MCSEKVSTFRIFLQLTNEQNGPSSCLHWTSYAAYFYSACETPVGYDKVPAVAELIQKIVADIERAM